MHHSTCMACVVDLHEECWEPIALDTGYWQCCCWQNSDPDAKSAREGRVAGVDEVTEVLSTGRKRAAMVAPIFPGMPCEWAGLRYAGGGPHPIVGCVGNTIADVKKNADLPENATKRGERHHGPDKNTLNNAPGTNLHRICSACHTHWHALNDRYYADERPGADVQWLPLDGHKNFRHDPDTKATPEELALSEQWWGTRTEMRKTPYPFPPPSE